jgi:hypothetical protein
MLSYCSDGEGSDGIVAGLDRAEGEIAQLVAQLVRDRAEIDRLWNEDVEGLR